MITLVRQNKKDTSICVDRNAFEIKNNAVLIDYGILAVLSNDQKKFSEYNDKYLLAVWAYENYLFDNIEEHK
jgi:hypothetical protein